MVYTSYGPPEVVQRKAVDKSTPQDNEVLVRIDAAGVDSSLERCALQDALISVITDRRGYCTWDVDHAGWVITLMDPEEQTFSGRTLSEGRAVLGLTDGPDPRLGPDMVSRDASAVPRSRTSTSLRIRAQTPRSRCP